MQPAIIIAACPVHTHPFKYGSSCNWLQQTHLPSPRWVPPSPGAGAAGGSGAAAHSALGLEVMAPPALEQEASYASTMAGVDLRILVGQLQVRGSDTHGCVQ